MICVRRAHILATFGPDSQGRDKIAALAPAGVIVFRHKFSHDFHEEPFGVPGAANLLRVTNATAR